MTLLGGAALAWAETDNKQHGNQYNHHFSHGKLLQESPTLLGVGIFAAVNADCNPD